MAELKTIVESWDNTKSHDRPTLENIQHNFTELGVRTGGGWRIASAGTGTLATGTVTIEGIITSEDDVIIVTPITPNTLDDGTEPLGAKIAANGTDAEFTAAGNNNFSFFYMVLTPVS